MSRWALTRAASAAQPRGAAVLPLVFTRRTHDLRVCRDDCSFICARTPARWQRVRLWWRTRLCAHGPGGTVLWFYTGPGARTGKPLETCGSVVLFCGSTRDACGGVCVHACSCFPQNHRTIELRGGKIANPRRCRFLARFCGSERIKYRVDMPAALATSPIGPDQRVKAGGARRNFRGRIAPGGGDRGLELGRIQLLASDGFLPFSEGRAGLVGMAMLERAPKGEACQSLRPVRRQPAGLASLALGDPRGVSADRTPGTPPSAARRSLRGWAQPIFMETIDLLNRRIGTHAGSGQLENGENGSGLGILPRLALAGPRSGASLERGERVRDRGASCCPAKRRAERATLWGGFPHVN